MDEADRVLTRLARIDELREGGGGADLLDELRALVPEAEAWARAEGDARAHTAAHDLRNPKLWQRVPELERRRTRFGDRLSQEAEGMD